MANVEYKYVGNPFKDVSGPSQLDKITGWFQVNDVDVPRPTPYINYDITSVVTAFSFTDGVQILNSANHASAKFLVTLDAAGNMVRPWTIVVQNQNNNCSISTYASDGSPATDETQGPDGYTARVDNNPGIWSMSSPPA